MAKRKIALLGGSFDPAHEGHVHISQCAIKVMQVDEVWWVVAQQNPLKSRVAAPFLVRVAIAKSIIAPHNKIKICTCEAKLRRAYTYETVIYLQDAYPDTKFVWVMGDDNLTNLPRWHRWKELVQMIPIAVFCRLHTPLRLAFSYLSPYHPKPDLLVQEKYGWTLFLIKKHPMSSTVKRSKC